MISINTYFTGTHEVRDQILKLLDEAENNVMVAVAWFTDRPLFKKLLEIQTKGVKVELIITDHQFNHQCSNEYSLIEENNGFFGEVGDDEKLMHMKFCVIDMSTVISGSANWSNRAFTVNNEEVTIVQNHSQRALEFVEEFEKLKILSGKIKSLKKQLDIAKALKQFDAIKVLLTIGDTSTATRYIHQLRNIEELEHITTVLLSQDYEKGLLLMEEFRKSYTQLIDINKILVDQLLSQIKLMSYQIHGVEMEKSEIEAQLDYFNHRCAIELNPIISKILALKKKIYARLVKHGLVDQSYDDIEREFEEANRAYEEEKDKQFAHLEDDELEDLKSLYKEASKLCHPDSHLCIFDDKKIAAENFSKLTKAYKRRDLKTVKYLHGEFILGNTNVSIENICEIDFLRLRLETLKVKYDYLLSEFNELKLSKEYQSVLSISNYDQYFTQQKQLLEKEYATVKLKYTS